MDSLFSQFNNLSIKNESKPLQIQHQLEAVKKNPKILTDMLGALNSQNYSNWRTLDFTNKVYQLTELKQNMLEYIMVEMSFNNSMRRPYKVKRVIRVENPYLLVQYNLKKLKKQCSEQALFHGTQEFNIEPICSQNFNWRLNGRSVGHKFGHGVSFSPDSNYSSDYPRNRYLRERVMFVVDVLIKSTCIGHHLMNIPPGSADTSIRPNGKVVVKYEDNDFCPKYIIYYS